MEMGGNGKNDSDDRIDPIFILGIMQRSGTNFLYDLLTLHPDCFRSNISEDYLMVDAELLEEYAKRIYQHWPLRWRVRIKPIESLYQSIGDGLISFLKMNLYSGRCCSDNSPAAEDETEQSVAQYSKKFATKTPSVENLPFFPKLFPNAPLLLLVRDGRAVVESKVKTYNTSYEEEMKLWAKGAETILQFDEEMRKSDYRYMIVKYEDLHLHTEREMSQILTFLMLDPDRYDFEGALNLPVRGSSELHKQEKEHWRLDEKQPKFNSAQSRHIIPPKRHVHWKPVEKKSGFDPIARFSHWDWELHEQFNSIAGNYLEKMGYAKHRLDGQNISP